MADIEFKYSWLKDPDTCPIEELEKQVKDLSNLVGFYDTKQLAIKKFINSVYGALGSKYFVAYNVLMAESITAQGRDLNHYSENSVNEYFKGIFQSNPEITLYYQWVYHDDDGTKYTYATEEKPDDYYRFGKWEECESWEPAVKKGKKLTPELKSCLQDNSEGHCDWFMTKTTLAKKLGVDPEKMKTFDISKGKTTETGELTGPEYDYLEGTQSMIIGGDTDSVSGDSEIIVDGIDMRISDFFISSKYANNDVLMVTTDGSEVVPVHGHMTRTYDEHRDRVVMRDIKYIMRHKVKKAKYKITTESGKEVIVTEDHSCMVIRDGELISIKAKDIDKETDKIITV